MEGFAARLERAKKTLVQTDFPTQVVVESTSICNFDCPGCPSPTLHRSRGFIDMELFKKIVDEIAVEKPDTQLWFAFMGEAFLWKNLFELIRYAKARGLTDTRLNTNGSIMTEKKIRDIHDSGVDRIIVSIDGHSRETFDAIRPWKAGNYDTVRANTIKLLDRAKDEKWTHPEIWVQMVVQDLNAHEESAFRSFWSAKGAVVKVRPMFSWGEKVEAKKLEQAEIPRDFPCPWLMRQMVIAYDGTFLLCNADSEAEYPLGNANKISIKEAWNGRLKEIRDQHIGNDFSFPKCVTCPDWKVGMSEIQQPEN